MERLTTRPDVSGARPLAVWRWTVEIGVMLMLLDLLWWIRR